MRWRPAGRALLRRIRSRCGRPCSPGAARATSGSAGPRSSASSTSRPRPISSCSMRASSRRWRRASFLAQGDRLGAAPARPDRPGLGARLGGPARDRTSGLLLRRGDASGLSGFQARRWRPRMPSDSALIRVLGEGGGAMPTSRKGSTSERHLWGRLAIAAAAVLGVGVVSRGPTAPTEPAQPQPHVEVLTRTAPSCARR